MEAVQARTGSVNGPWADRLSDWPDCLHFKSNRRQWEDEEDEEERREKRGRSWHFRPKIYFAI